MDALGFVVLLGALAIVTRRRAMVGAVRAVGRGVRRLLSGGADVPEPTGDDFVTLVVGTVVLVVGVVALLWALALLAR